MLQVIIDPGHGGIDSGASRPEIGFIGKDYNLKISLYQFKRFAELGISAALTRATDVFIDLNERAKIVKNSFAAHCLCNHLNAGGGRGAEVIKSHFDTDTRFPTYLQTELEAIGMEWRRVYDRLGSDGLDYYAMHRETGNVKTYIIEYAFIDDDTHDYPFIINHWDKLAEAGVKAYCQFINAAYVPPGTPNVTPQPPQPNPKEYPPSYPQWKKDAVDFLFSNGFLTDETWKSKADQPLPLWAEAVLIKRLYENPKK